MSVQCLANPTALRGCCSGLETQISTMSSFSSLEDRALPGKVSGKVAMEAVWKV